MEEDKEDLARDLKQSALRRQTDELWLGTAGVFVLKLAGGWFMIVAYCYDPIRSSPKEGLQAGIAAECSLQNRTQQSPRP